MKIYQDYYKNIKCITLENERLVIKVIPQSGGKIQSIYDKKKNKEFLYQAPGEEYIISGYDDPFEKGECSGFDEMFPSIDACLYPDKPWEDVKIPDHGEVWPLQWDHEISGHDLKLKVCGMQFPYILYKKISFTGERKIRIEYRAENLSDSDFKFLWVAHPLFNCNEYTRILMPPCVKEIFNVNRDSSVLGGYGQIHRWPQTIDLNGNIVDISKVNPRTRNKCEKYYALNKLEQGWCALHDTESGDMVEFSFPEEKVPYLGVWVTEGGFNDQYNVAMEPCTGSFDNLQVADSRGVAGVLKPNSEYCWFLEIAFTENIHGN